MRDMTNPVQAACPAYYMGEEQGGSRGCWDIGGGLPHYVLPTHKRAFRTHPAPYEGFTILQHDCTHV